MSKQLIIPELDVSDLKAALGFYVGVVGFTCLYDRPEEKFAYLDLNGAQIMLQQADGPGRRFRTAPLEHPYGRGINLQIEVDDSAKLYERVREKGFRAEIPLEERWYRSDDIECGNRQFVVADPDGYLLRFFTDLGERSLLGADLRHFQPKAVAKRDKREASAEVKPLPVNFSRASLPEGI
jgi:catechol 2,3-dioxygenase-like lactoylglutathione lyase family enzyme